jgi:hypothetical protein
MTRLVTVLTTLLLVAAGAATAAAQDASPVAGSSELATIGLMELRISVAEDGTVDVPQEVEGGRYLVVVEVAASETLALADVSFVQVPSGMTVEEMAAQAEAAGEENAPPWLYETVLAGGVSVAAGSVGSVVVDLTEGEWLVDVFTEDVDEDEGEGENGEDAEGEDQAEASPAADEAGSPAADEGDMEEGFEPTVLTVTDEATAIAAVDIPAGQMVEMVDFDFSIPDTVPAGPQIWQVTNTGSQPHHLIIEKTGGAVTEEQLGQLIAFEFGMAEAGATPAADLPDPEQFTPAGGLGLLSSGQTAWIELTLDPGTYIALCFIPDQETGMPHIAMGMYEIFTVE